MFVIEEALKNLRWQLSEILGPMFDQYDTEKMTIDFYAEEIGYLAEVDDLASKIAPYRREEAGEAMEPTENAVMILAAKALKKSLCEQESYSSQKLMVQGSLEEVARRLTGLLGDLGVHEDKIQDLMKECLR